MEKLILNKTDTYKLEVNDNGDYIEFDLTDLSLPKKIMEASENLERINNEYLTELSKIEERYKGDKISITKETILLEESKCLQMRKEFDSFLGEGACQKIFGDINRYGMFEELFEGLEPHFAKMKINIKKVKEKLVNKYLPKRNDVM